jgi:hypothetical protein
MWPASKHGWHNRKIAPHGELTVATAAAAP